MSRNVYLFDNMEFSSIRELSKYTKINEKTLTARLRRGMTVDEACKPTDFRCSYHLIENNEKSIAQICKEKSKDADLIRNRLKYGYSLNDALTRPKKISKQGISIIVNGVLYTSIASALKNLDLTHKESTVRRRLKSGMKPNEAFYFDDL